MEVAVSEGLKHKQNVGKWDRMGIRYLGRLHARPYARTSIPTQRRRFCLI